MKNKLFTSVILLCVALSACVSRISEDEMMEKRLTFHTSLVSETLPFSENARSTDAINSLIVFDCVNGKLNQTISQSYESGGFGTVSMSLPYGKHELLFVGHKTEEPSFSYPYVTFDETHDTFSYRLSLTVDEDTNASQSIQLSRSVAAVKLVAIDAIPEGVSALRMKLSACYNTLDITTGYASGESSSVSRTFTYSTSHIGKKGSTYSIYTFVPNREHSTDVTVEILNKEGSVISTTSIKELSVERNRKTVLTGELFGTKTDAVIYINDIWGNDVTYPIK